jgi:hypothetical protein
VKALLIAALALISFTAQADNPFGRWEEHRYLPDWAADQVIKAAENNGGACHKLAVTKGMILVCYYPGEMEKN